MTEAAILHSPNGHSPPLPDALRECNQWITYRLETKNGKLDKIPTDRDRKVNIDKLAAGNWLSHSKAYSYASTKDHLDGVGFVLTDRDPLACIDVDGCRNPETGKIDPWAQRIIDYFGSYAEVSVSGTGVHIFVYGKVHGSTRPVVGGRRIEAYSADRFMAVTGNQVEGTPLELADGQDWLDQLAERAGPSKNVNTAGIPEPPEDVTEDQIIGKLEAARNAPKFQRLFYDGITDGDDSAADMALACMVAFYTGSNIELAERIMRRSALYREKWDRRSPYILPTIENAVGRQIEFYQWNRPEKVSDENTGVVWLSSEIVRDSEKVSDENLTPNKASSERKLFRTAREIASSVPEQTRWTVKPWIGPGLITEVIGPPKKSGKTTWLTYAARCVLDGLPFMGEPTEKGPVVYLTEQSAGSFREALKRADLTDRDDFVVVSWGDTAGMKWPDVAALAAEEAERIGAEMLVVDTLTPFAGIKGDQENNAGDAMAAVEPLKLAAQKHNLAVVMVRHARKGGGDVGESGRGSGAFIAEVDIHISITGAKGNNANVRKIETLSRFDAVPDELYIELTESGYKASGADGKVKTASTREAICDLLPRNVNEAMPESKLLDKLDAGRDTAKRALNDLYYAAVIDVEGAGKRGNPYCYYYEPLVAIQDYDESGQLVEIWRNPDVPDAA